MALDAPSTIIAVTDKTGVSLFVQAIVLLGAAVIFVPVFKKLGLGSVLGYLGAGVVIGLMPFTISDGEQLLHFAELGIVFLLFIVGLELKPSRLLALRREIFGFGFLQVVLSALVFGLLCYAIGYSWKLGTLIGLGLALSSTAFALQILEERDEMNSGYGRKAFAIVLFQDIAIVPILAIIPFLVPDFLKGIVDSPQPSFDWLAAGKITVVIGGLILIGRYFLNPLFRIIANTGAREMMIVVALFIVLGAAFATQTAGLSMALGAFLAGVMLADSAYRHELEANIEPFRGVLLGLFFMAVGLSLNVEVIFDNWITVLIAAPVVMIVKAAVMYAMLRAMRTSHNDALRIASLLPQVGEFAFVIFSTAVAAHTVSEELASIITAIVTVTMALTPFSVRLGERFLDAAAEDTMDEDFEGASGQVFVIGFGRFGQVVSQALLAQGVHATIIDHNAERIRNAATFGFRIFYGEGRRLDVLRAAGIANASIVAVCSNGRERTNEIIRLIREHFPNVRLYVRSFDRSHTLELMDMEVDYQIREMFESALAMGRNVLDGLDVPQDRIDDIIEDLRKRDLKRLQLQQTKGLFAGADLAFRNMVTPEPLTEPQKKSVLLSEATVKVAEQTDTAKAADQQQKP